jgi:hypothetical protein
MHTEGRSVAESSRWYAARPGRAVAADYTRTRPEGLLSDANGRETRARRRRLTDSVENGGR